MAIVKNINTKLAIEELHRAFKFINDDFFEGKLPEPAILIQSRGNKTLTLGWCSVNKIWLDGVNNVEKYEINIVAESLNRGLIPVITTLMHEMVHLHNLENNIKDTSRGNTYHNNRFKEEAEKRGLKVEYADKIGFSLTTMTNETMRKVYDYKLNGRAFSLGRKPTSKREKKKPSSSRKYECPQCKTIVRATKDVNIICGDCNVEFVLLNPRVQFQCDDCKAKFEGDTNTTVCPKCNSSNISILQKDTGEDENSPVDNEPKEIPVENEPKDTPINETIVEFCCKNCGSLFEGGSNLKQCIECGSDEIVALTEVEPKPPAKVPTEEPTQEPEPERETKATPVHGEAETVEIETTLDDGSEVKQRAFKEAFDDITNNEKYSDTTNSEWNEERIRKVLIETNDFLSKRYGHSFDATETPFIFNKSKAQLACCSYIYVKTKGRGADKLVIKNFKFSENLLTNFSDRAIFDTIKHEFIHAWIGTLKNKQQGHNDLFKRYCKIVNCNGATKTPYKSLSSN